MLKYFYSVKDGSGTRQTGTIDASNRQEALNLLRERFPLVLRLDEVGPGKVRRISQDDILTFTQQISSLLGSGISFGAALDILLRERVHRPGMRRILVDVAATVADGRSFSEALRNHQTVFGELYVCLVEAGEASATLPVVLKRLADSLQKAQRFRLDVLAAVLYPALVFCFGIVVSIGMLAYGAPVVKDLYASAGIPLPRMSVIFLEFGDFLARNGITLALLLSLFVFLVSHLKARPFVRRIAWYSAMNLGPLKEFLMEASVARCTRTLATLYGSGVPVLCCLDLTARSAGNEIMRDLFLKVKELVANGSSLSEPLLASPHFPAIAGGMVAAGEAAGNLAVMLESVAEHYETRLEFALRSLPKTLEPLLVVTVGVLVGAVILALGLPFMNLVALLA